MNDICINKHGGNSQSNAANLRVDKFNDCDIILAYLLKHKTGTLKEIARYMGKEKNEISGRFSELQHKLNLIVDTGDRRENCAVYAIKEELKLF